MTMSLNKIPFYLFLSCLLFSCVEDTDSGSDIDTTSGGRGSNDCNLREIISDSDRSSANQGGIQCSSQIANADAYYGAALEACRTGETGTDPDTGATTDFNDVYDVYVQAANFALETVDRLGSAVDSFIAQECARAGGLLLQVGMVLLLVGMVFTGYQYDCCQHKTVNTKQSTRHGKVSWHGR